MTRASSSPRRSRRSPRRTTAGNTYIGKKALHDELFSTKGYDGISGPINCDEHGQCGAFNFAVYQFTDRRSRRRSSPAKIRRRSIRPSRPSRLLSDASGRLAHKWAAGPRSAIAANLVGSRDGFMTTLARRSDRRSASGRGPADSAICIGSPSSISCCGHCASGSSAAGRRRHDRHPLEGHLRRPPLVRLLHVRSHHRRRLCADRARLHDGLRRPAPDQLRPWRHRHDRRILRILPGAQLRPQRLSRCLSRHRDAGHHGCCPWRSAPQPR